MAFFDFLKDIPFVGPIISGVSGIASAREANRAQDERQQEAQGFNAQEAALAREFNAQQAALTRDYNSAEAVKARDFNASEAEKGRQWADYQGALSRQFNSNEADENRWYQTVMSNTQYQRSMADMRAAGLNPMLAYSQGGAGTPVGSAAHNSAVSAASASGGAASSGAASGPSASSPGPLAVNRMDFSQVLSSALALAQLDKVNAETERTRTETKVIGSDIIDKDKPDSYFEPGTYSARERNMRANLLNEEAMKAREGIYLTHTQKELVDEEIKNAVKYGRKIEADTRDTTANAVLRELAASEAKAGSDFWKKYPQAYDAGQGLKLLGQGINAANPLARVLGR